MTCNKLSSLVLETKVQNQCPRTKWRGWQGLGEEYVPRLFQFLGAAGIPRSLATSPQSSRPASSDLSLPHFQCLLLWVSLYDMSFGLPPIRSLAIIIRDPPPWECRIIFLFQDPYLNLTGKDSFPYKVTLKGSRDQNLMSLGGHYSANYTCLSSKCWKFSAVIHLNASFSWFFLFPSSGSPAKSKLDFHVIFYFISLFFHVFNFLT